MTAIPLREYNQVISTLIDRGLTDEASDHCRFILSKYPKTLETYRLLGKAYLESSRYLEAGDTFLRVLAVTPDDYLAHAGMSIIREESGNLQAAIWHMERAFECQPGNTAIQAELKLLYGKRDGSQPEKIRLTRGAICRMYARGNQYRQAIAEVRAVLKTTPDRYDLDVLLAELLAATDQKDECKNICLRILQKYPFCQSCNQLMLKLSVPGSSDASKYDHRLTEIDPYHAYLSADYPQADSVPADKVMLDKLEYFTPTELSIGTVLDHEHFEEAPMPDAEIDMDDTQPILLEDADTTSGPVEIPDWLEPEGNEQIYESSGSELPDTFEEIKPESELPEVDSEVPPSIPDIPAWEREEAPHHPDISAPGDQIPREVEAAGQASIKKTTDEVDETPEWLKNLFVDDTPRSTSPMWSTPTPDDYLADEPVEGQTSTGDVSENTISQDVSSGEENNIPDWLNELDGDESVMPSDPILPDPEVEEPSETPPVLDISEESVPDATTSPSVAAPPPVSESDEFEIPEWLKNIHEDDGASVPELAPPSDNETSAEGPVDLVTRIKELTALQRSGLDPTLTCQQVEDLLSQHSDNASLWLLAGDLRKETGNLAGAIEAYTKAESILKSSQAN